MRDEPVAFRRKRNRVLQDYRYYREHFEPCEHWAPLNIEIGWCAVFKYRSYPAPEQERASAKTCGCIRYVYNRARELRSRAWRERQQRISYNASSRVLTGWKREPGTAWLTEVSCVPFSSLCGISKRLS